MFGGVVGGRLGRLALPTGYFEVSSRNENATFGTQSNCCATVIFASLAPSLVCSIENRLIGTMVDSFLPGEGRDGPTLVFLPFRHFRHFRHFHHFRQFAISGISGAKFPARRDAFRQIW